MDSDLLITISRVCGDAQIGISALLGGTIHISLYVKVNLIISQKAM